MEQIPGTCWPAHLTESANSRFSERTCLREIKLSKTLEVYTHTHVNTHRHIHTYMQTHTEAQTDTNAHRYTHRHLHIHRHTCTDNHRHTHTHTIKKITLYAELLSLPL